MRKKCHGISWVAIFSDFEMQMTPCRRSTPADIAQMLSYADVVACG